MCFKDKKESLLTEKVRQIFICRMKFRHILKFGFLLLVAFKMISNLTNITDHPDDNPSDTNNMIDITIFVLGAVFAILYMVILNTLLINLNRTMKKILNILLAHGFLTYVFLVITIAIGRNTFTCGLMTVVYASSFHIVFAHFAIIPSVRFYLFKKSIENRHPDEKLIIGLTSLVYILVYIICILYVILLDTPYEEFCLDDPSTSKDPIAFIIHGAIALFVLSLGLYFDDKYIGLSKNINQQSSNSYQENEFVIPVKTSWASLFINLAFIVMTAILAPKDRKVSFTAANIVGVVFPNLLLLTILGLAYKESINFKQRKDRKDHRYLQSLVHIKQLNKNRRRTEQNSVTGENIQHLLQDACETLIGDQILEHTLAPEPKVFGTNYTSNFVQVNKVDMSGGQKLQETKKAQKRPKSNKVDIQVEIHQELSHTRLKSARTQSNIGKDVIITYQQHLEEAAKRNAIPRTDQQTKSGLGQSDLSEIQLYFEEDDVNSTFDIIDIKSMLDEEKMTHYNLSERKLEGQIFDKGKNIPDQDNLNKEHEMQEIQRGKKSHSNKVVIQAEVHQEVPRSKPNKYFGTQPNNGIDASEATCQEHSASNVEESIILQIDKQTENDQDHSNLIGKKVHIKDENVKGASEDIHRYNELAYYGLSESKPEDKITNQEKYKTSSVSESFVIKNPSANATNFVQVSKADLNEEYEMYEMGKSQKSQAEFQHHDSSDSITESMLDEMIDEELDYYNLSERKMGDRIIDHGKFKKCDSYSIDLKESQEISVTQRLPDDQHDETRKVLSFGKSIDNDIAEIFANFEGITFLSISFLKL